MGKNTEDKNIFLLSEPLFLIFSLTARPWEEKEESKEKKATVCCSTFEASLSGLAAWSCVSKPRRAFHPLCCPRCVQCTGALCGEGDDTSHSVFCPELGDGGTGGLYNRGGTKSKLIEGRGSSKSRCTKAYKALLHAELCQM